MTTDIDSIVAQFSLSDDVASALQDAMATSNPHSGFAELSLNRAPITLCPVDPTPEWDEAEDSQPIQRYENLGLLGVGGMGEVRRVLDRDLNRVMAMKVIKATLLKHPSQVARFVEEAQATSQLQHPGIAPVHELGRLPDGRLYFTMRELRGRTIGEVVEEVHEVSPHRWETAPSGWTFRRLVDAFLRVCEAVAYAHDRGVVHRDIKPDNIMVGEHGEVLVVDWGLAKLLGRDDIGGVDNPIQTDRTSSGVHATRAGAIMGTPAYMPPEQAFGDTDRIDPRTDVYSLGAVLYVLLADRLPYEGDTPAAILREVVSGPPPSPQREGRPLIPVELAAICERAMAFEQADRYANAGEMAQDVAAWLDGARTRERARVLVEQAHGLDSGVKQHLDAAAALDVQADELLANIKPWQPEADKVQGWAKQDAAEAQRRQANLISLEQESLLRGSLTLSPDLPEAHAALADRYREAHQRAEKGGTDTLRSEVLMRTHVEALPTDHPDRASHLAYLDGAGRLTLHTEPPGAEVDLYRYGVRNRRLVADFVRHLGSAPLDALPLAMGSYLCQIRTPGAATVSCPIHLDRGEHWTNIRPGDHAPTPVRVPNLREVGANECYIPAGWAWTGGDPDARAGLPSRRVWCDSMAFMRFPITNRQYIAFLEDLVARGEERTALRLAPREKAGTTGDLGALIYDYDGARFSVRRDADGDLWLEDWPVIMVDWFGANAYAEWASACDGLPWRLPSELEWERAVRGADRRFYPWGNAVDPSWCCMRESTPGGGGPMPIDSFPVDISPYGVRGLAGNTQDWCADAFLPDGPDTPNGIVPLPDVADPTVPRAYRGGSWGSTPANIRAAARASASPSTRFAFMGFRLVRSLFTPSSPNGLPTRTAITDA